MKPLFFVAATLAVSLALPAWAQTQIDAPAGWTTQTKAKGATTFTPGDLKAGEKYSVTVYEPAPMNGKTLEEYLRSFAGPVGKTAGKLGEPLQIETADGSVVSGSGVYLGPNQTWLFAQFLGVTMDGGAHVRIMRALSSLQNGSQDGSAERYQALVARYKAPNDALMKQMILRANEEAGGNVPAKPGQEKRYQWTVAPGKGVSNAQIATIWHRSDYDVITSVRSTVYLLLRDGSVYADLPVPPDELDIARSKAHEPDKWGRWRKTALGYSVSMGDAPFEALSGEQVAPAPAQLRLTGRYSTGRGSNDGAGFSSYSLWGVTFDKTGRFIKDGRGGASSSTGFGEGTSRTDTMFDAQGASATATGPGYVAGSSQRNPNGDREGTYSLSGYVLTLRYDNGRVARLPFFFIGRDVIWFEGALLNLNKGL